MKKFLSIMMALVLVIALSVTAFAAESDDKGSITITNATVGKTYSIYKIFDAKIAVGADDETFVSYSITSANQFFDDLFGAEGKTANPYFVYNATTGAVTLNSDIDTAAEKSAMFDYLKNMVETAETAAEPILADSEKVEFTDLDYGYYLITTDNGTAVTIDSNTPDVEVIDKNQKVGNLTKKIWDEDAVVADKQEKGEWTDEISSNVGDVEKFKIEFTATNYDGEYPVKYYTVKDVNGSALAINYDSFKVTVDGAEITKGTDATNSDAEQWFLVQNGDSFDIVIPWLTGYSFNNGTIVYGDITDATPLYGATETVVIEYTATVEENADIAGANGNTHNKNTAHLEWSYSNETGTTAPDTTDIFVYAMGINKIDAATKDSENVKYLAGAQFEIYRDADCKVPVNVKSTTTTGVYILDATGSTNTVETGTDGKIAIIGLKEGTYYLKETKAPDGYNVLKDIETVIVGTATEDTMHGYTANTVTVLNSQGTELPSTGGMGTMMLITIGSMVAMAFAVLLITHKKMSIYHD